MTSVQNPGHWVQGMNLEGKMRSHREWVEVIAEQIGTHVQPDNAGYVNRFEVPSTSGPQVYLVSQRRTDGQWCCSCPGWKFHCKKGRTCKHVTDILQRLKAHTVLADAVRTSSQAVVADSVVAMLASARTAFDMLGAIR